jgi:hypothetical protein
MKYLVLLFLLIGCSEETRIKNTDIEQIIDQCLRAQLFKTCLETVPKGPEVVKNSDWSKIVAECETAANLQSYRQRKYVKPECWPF